MRPHQTFHGHLVNLSLINTLYETIYIEQNVHLYRTKRAQSNICPGCGSGAETLEHFLFDCEPFNGLRDKWLRKWHAALKATSHKHAVQHFRHLATHTTTRGTLRALDDYVVNTRRFFNKTWLNNKKLPGSNAHTPHHVGISLIVTIKKKNTQQHSSFDYQFFFYFYWGERRVSRAPGPPRLLSSRGGACGAVSGSRQLPTPSDTASSMRELQQLS